LRETTKEQPRAYRSAGPRLHRGRQLAVWPFVSVSSCVALMELAAAGWLLGGLVGAMLLIRCAGKPGRHDVLIFDFVHQERVMTVQNVPAGTAPAASTATVASPAPVPAPPSLPWRQGALILAGAAQLITISVLVACHYPLAATWWSLLLAIAPALVVLAVGTVKLWREQSQALAGG
jgi:hypothetical protein